MRQNEKPDSGGEAGGAEPCVVNFGGEAIDGFTFLSSDFEKSAPEGGFQRNRGAVAVQGERVLQWPRVRHRA